MQTKLLRVLQESRVLGVGEDQEVSIDVRIIAATNRDLGEMVGDKRFRADLFHRLGVLSIRIPPLRTRLADIRPLIENFLRKYRPLNASPELSVDAEFVEAVSRLELPGNARQLENLVREALLNKQDGSPLTLSDLPPEIWRRLADQGEVSLAWPPQAGEEQLPRGPTPRASEHGLAPYVTEVLDTSGWNLARSLEYCERLLLEAALHLAHGNQSQTARILGITPRSVYTKLRKHRLHR